MKKINLALALICCSMYQLQGMIHEETSSRGGDDHQNKERPTEGKLKEIFNEEEAREVEEARKAREDEEARKLQEARADASGNAGNDFINFTKDPDFEKNLLPVFQEVLGKDSELLKIIQNPELITPDNFKNIHNELESLPEKLKTTNPNLLRNINATKFIQSMDTYSYHLLNIQKALNPDISVPTPDKNDLSQNPNEIQEKIVKALPKIQEALPEINKMLNEIVRSQRSQAIDKTINTINTTIDVTLFISLASLVMAVVATILATKTNFKPLKYILIGMAVLSYFNMFSYSYMTKDLAFQARAFEGQDKFNFSSKRPFSRGLIKMYERRQTLSDIGFQNFTAATHQQI